MCGFYDDHFPCMNLVTPEHFRHQLLQLLNTWRESGLPGHQTLKEGARRLLAWKQTHAIGGLWLKRPLWVSATIDDGMGHGLAIIDLYATVLGLRVISLGLMQPPEAIIARCWELHPDFLGLTVLHFDSEDLLRTIRSQIPPETKLVAGGPVFKADPDFAEIAGVDLVAANVGEFVGYMLRL